MSGVERHYQDQDSKISSSNNVADSNQLLLSTGSSAVPLVNVLTESEVNEQVMSSSKSFGIGNTSDSSVSSSTNKATTSSKFLLCLLYNWQ